MKSLYALCIILTLLFVDAQTSKAETPPTNLALSQPLTRAVFQRNDQNWAQVPIQGTYSGTATRIEARAIIMDGFTGTATNWLTIENNPSDGSFSSTLKISAGGWYQLEVQAYNGDTPSSITRVYRIGVGEVFITAGQSNSANCGSPAYTPAHSTVSAWTGTNWRHAYDPQPIASCTGGSPWSRLADLLIDELNVPIGFVSVGVAGTRVDRWVPSANDLYPLLHDAIMDIGPTGMRAILWHQGESDAVRPPTTDTETYAARLKQVIQQSRIDAGFPVPWGIALVSWMPESYNQQEEWRQGVRNGQIKVIQSDPFNFLGPDTDIWPGSEFRHDTIHFNALGLQLHAEAWMPTIRQIMHPWDLNQDTQVNLLDLSDFSSYWLDDRYWFDNNSNMAIHLKLDDATNSIASDSSGNNRNGTLFNNPTWAGGIYNGAISFDGIDDYIQIEGYTGISGYNPRTITSWIKLNEDLENNDKNLYVIMSWGKSDTTDLYKKWMVLINETSGQLALAIYGARIVGGPDLEDGKWHHIAIVLPDGANNINQIKMFVDGIEVATNADSLNAVIDTTASEDVLIGTIDTDPANGIQHPNYFFKGLIDDIRIYDVAMTADDFVPSCDLDRNGTINLADFSVIASHWLE